MTGFNRHGSSERLEFECPECESVRVSAEHPTVSPDTDDYVGHADPDGRELVPGFRTFAMTACDGESLVFNAICWSCGTVQQRELTVADINTG